MNRQELYISSIGPKWPPEESSFNRIKGLDNRRVIRDGRSFKASVDEIRGVMSEAREGRIDRVSIRLFVEDPVWLSSLEAIGDLGELVIPLSGSSPEFEEVSILYLGSNADSRQPNLGELARSMANVERALGRRIATYSELTQRASNQGYALTLLDLAERTVSEKLQDQMVSLYARFGWTREDVLGILSQENNIIAVAFDDRGRIVSAGIAETSMVKFLDNTELRIVEITEAATEEDHKGRGLYSAVAAELMHEIYVKSEDEDIFGGNVDLVFGECNGNEPGVLKAVKSLGRTFAIEVSRGLSIPFKGYLPQHVPIAGAPKTTKYNDLFPAFMVRNSIPVLFEK